MKSSLSARRLAALFALLSGAYLLSYFFRSANAVIAPDLSSDLGLSAGQLGFMTSLFYAAYALSQVPIGSTLDRWGPKIVTPLLMLVGAAGCVLFAVAPSFSVLAVARVLIGIGMGSIILGALKAFGTWYPQRRFATLSGALFGLGSLGALGAATPLAWLNNTIGWRGVFGWGSLVVIASALTLYLATPALAGSREAETETEEGSSAIAWGAMRHLLPLAFVFVGTTLSFQTLWAGPYLFDLVGLSEIGAGNALLVLSLGVSLGYALSGWTADRVGLWNATAGSCAVFVAAQFALAATPGATLVFVLYFVFGLSGGFCILPLSNARRITTREATGRAVALINLFGIGGAFLLQWALGILLDATSVEAVGIGNGYVLGLLVTGVATLIALLWYLPVRRVISPSLQPPRSTDRSRA